jgi:hypothetical protein
MILCEPGPGVRPLRLAKRLRGGERRPAAPALTHCWQATRQVQVPNNERRELERLGDRHATDLRAAVGPRQNHDAPVASGTATAFGSRLPCGSHSRVKGKNARHTERNPRRVGH